MQDVSNYTGFTIVISTGKTEETLNSLLVVFKYYLRIHLPFEYISINYRIL